MRAVSLILASLNASLASCSSFVNAHLASATQGPARAAAAAGGSRLVEAEIRSAGFHPQARSSCTARPARDNKCYAHYARTSQEKKAAGEFKGGAGGTFTCCMIQSRCQVSELRGSHTVNNFANRLNLLSGASLSEDTESATRISRSNIHCQLR